MRCSIGWLATPALALLVACGEQPGRVSAPADPGSSAASVLSASPIPVSDPWIAAYQGRSGEGSQYALFMPKQWNGDLVLYAHGIIQPQLPVELPTGDSAEAIRDLLGQTGYAVAYSSFSENGYAFKDGLQRTEQLRGLFVSKFSKPQRTFLVGQSLGSQIVEALAEQQHSPYAGAFAMCGELGGTRMELNYIAHIRTLFDYFYPGVLPGNTMWMPVITDLNAQVLDPAFYNISIAPYAFMEMLQVDQAHMDYADQNELFRTLGYVLTYQAVGTNDVIARAHGHFVFDNMDTVYTSATLPQEAIDSVNRYIHRYASPPDAQQWLNQNYEPTGRLRIPMVTLHNTRDPLVPYRHEDAYKAKVADAGAGSLLLQRPVTQWGHCDKFQMSDVMSAFGALVNWVDTGVKPAS